MNAQPASPIRALAVDFDGTLTEHGRPATRVLDALGRFRASGRSVLLVTGRMIDELREVFPDVEAHVDAIVAENGGLLVHGGFVRLLAHPVDHAVDAALASVGIPFRRGRVLLATRAEHADRIGHEIGKLGLEYLLTRNRGELMVLPAGVTKGTGVSDGLAELGVSLHNAAGIGDAENDHTLLAACEIGVAVANAVPALRERADHVTERAAGDGVVEVIDGGLVAGWQRLFPARWQITLGRASDGSAVALPSAGINLLVTGPSRSGKSYVTGLLGEQLTHLGYTVLFVDPEGDYGSLQALPGVVLLGGHDLLPSGDQLVSFLTHRSGSVVLDLSGRSEAEQEHLYRHLPALVEAYRAATGRPHWVVIDEAHEPLGPAGPSRRFYTPEHRGYCIVTFRPDGLPDEVLASIDAQILLPGAQVSERHRLLTGLPAEPLPELLGSLVEGRAVLHRRPGLVDGPDLCAFTLAARETLHVRHRHRYVHELLPEHHTFRFRTATGETGIEAANLVELHREVARCEPDSLRHHATTHDLSQWLDQVFGDQNLATTIRRLEDVIRADPVGNTVEQVRRKLLDAIEARYLRTH